MSKHILHCNCRRMLRLQDVVASRVNGKKNAPDGEHNCMLHSTHTLADICTALSSKTLISLAYNYCHFGLRIRPRSIATWTLVCCVAFTSFGPIRLTIRTAHDLTTFAPDVMQIFEDRSFPAMRAVTGSRKTYVTEATVTFQGKQRQSRRD